MIGFVTLAWLATVVTGFCMLWGYENTPGKSSRPPLDWPSESEIEPGTDRPTLLLFAHPRCPCTRASIRELSLIMARCQELVETRVLFIRPAEFDVDWEKTDLWRTASGIPGVRVRADIGHEEARRFQVRTSGVTLLYDTAGRLLFRGGITGSRGHQGDNAGRSAIVSLLTGGEAEREETFAFGCALNSTGGCPDESCRGEKRRCCPK